MKVFVSRDDLLYCLEAELPEVITAENDKMGEPDIDDLDIEELIYDIAERLSNLVIGLVYELAQRDGYNLKGGSVK